MWVDTDRSQKNQLYVCPKAQKRNTCFVFWALFNSVQSASRWAFTRSQFSLTFFRRSLNLRERFPAVIPVMYGVICGCPDPGLF